MPDHYPVSRPLTVPRFRYQVSSEECDLPLGVTYFPLLSAISTIMVFYVLLLT